eukprot:747261-Hanusia_phi.AAC.5
MFGCSKRTHFPEVHQNWKYRSDGEAEQETRVSKRSRRGGAGDSGGAGGQPTRWGIGYPEPRRDQSLSRRRGPGQATGSVVRPVDLRMGAELSSMDRGLKCDCCSNLSSNRDQGGSKPSYRFPPTRTNASSINQGVLLDNLLTLAEHGQPQALQSFLDARKDIDVNMQNEEGDTALHLAARRGKINNCKILLQVLRYASLRP